MKKEVYVINVRFTDSTEIVVASGYSEAIKMIIADINTNLKIMHASKLSKKQEKEVEKSSYLERWYKAEDLQSITDPEFTGIIGG